MSDHALSTTVDTENAPVSSASQERSRAGFASVGVEISRADTGERFDVYVISAVPAEVCP